MAGHFNRTLRPSIAAKLHGICHTYGGSVSKIVSRDSCSSLGKMLGNLVIIPQVVGNCLCNVTFYPANCWGTKAGHLSYSVEAVFSGQAVRAHCKPKCWCNWIFCDSAALQMVFLKVALDTQNVFLKLETICILNCVVINIDSSSNSSGVLEIKQECSQKTSLQQQHWPCLEKKKYFLLPFFSSLNNFNLIILRAGVFVAV